MKKTAILSLLLLCGVAATAQPGYIPSEQNLKAREEFNDDRFGIFIHWGIYSMLGQGEWAMQVQNLNYQEYAHLADGFYPSKFDATQWVRAFKAAGARYLTITSRHHDGFSMFGTKASGYNVVDATPFGRDVIGEIAQACQQEGLKLHLYYSHLDWGRTDFYPRGRTGNGTGRPDEGDWNSYLSFMNAQLTELLTGYGPIGAIWFDGVWDMDDFPYEDQPRIWNLYEQYELIHTLQPSCLIGNNHHKTPFEGEDMQIFERDIPGQNEFGLSGQEISRLPLETCQTMNRSWGYRITDTDYKSAEDLIKLLVRTAGKGANLLLNIGPRPDGTIPEQALERLEGIGKWLEQYGESIYGTDAGYLGDLSWGVSTQKDNALYLHVLEHQDSIEIPAGSKPRSVTRLRDGSKLDFKYRKGVLTISCGAADPKEVDDVIRVEFRKSL